MTPSRAVISRMRRSYDAPRLPICAELDADRDALADLERFVDQQLVVAHAVEVAVPVVRRDAAAARAPAPRPAVARLVALLS
jgi:DNA polymerase III epsilon subunit-like protein